MSKTRGPSKAQIILMDAKNRVDRARAAVIELSAKQAAAQAVYEAQLDAYNGLEQAFARRPKSPSPAPSAADKRRAKMICVDCHLPSANQIHTDESNSAHHPFVLDRDGSPPSAPRAEKKSSSEKQPKLAGVLNTETEKAIAGSVGGSGD